MVKIIAGPLLTFWGTIVLAFACFAGEVNQDEILRRGIGALTGAWLVYLGVCVVSGMNPVGIALVYERITRKPMASLTFPRWSAPALGAAVGGYCILRGWHDVHFAAWEMQAAVVFFGFLSGCLVWVLDPAPKSRTKSPVELNYFDEGGQPIVQPIVQQSLVGRAVAVLAILVCWAPIVGTGMGFAAILINRASSGWPKKLGWIATGVSLVWVMVLIATSILAQFE